MCGIFGVVHFNDAPVDRLKAGEAAKALSHRGRDDYGTYYSPSGKAFFCHYRLSIIELSKLGHQPMTTDDGRYSILYNGEIYNCKSIKNSELKIKNWKTNSDTEVILKLFENYGEESLKKLRGMFAFAIWDEKEKSLFAARDRFGIKPFYYLLNKNEFIFSSELKAIQRYKQGVTISQKGMEAFLRTGSIPAPLTFYDEINSLMPGEFIKVNYDGKYTFKKWWSFEDILDSSYEVFEYNNEARREIRTALLDSFKVHSESDSEVGAFLSGEINSTAVVSLLKQSGHQKIKTVSVAFPGSSESSYAKMAAGKYEASHSEYLLTEDEAIDEMDKFFCITDQPSMGGLNSYFVSKAAASAGLKIVISGLGADELFGGYPTFSYIPKLEIINRIPFSELAMLMAGSLTKPWLNPKTFEYLKYSSKDYASYKLFRNLFSDKEIKELVPGLHSYPYELSSDYHNDYNSSVYNSTFITRHSALKYVSYLETTNYMANQLLRDSDTFSIYHSIKLKTPFADDNLYQVIMKYIDCGFDKNRPKRMLVDAAGDLPEEIVNRKTGFAFPFDNWVRNGKLGGIVKENILSADSFDRKGVEKLLRQFDEGKEQWPKLWALFVVSKFRAKGKEQRA